MTSSFVVLICFLSAIKKTKKAVCMTMTWRFWPFHRPFHHQEGSKVRIVGATKALETRTICPFPVFFLLFKRGEKTRKLCFLSKAEQISGRLLVFYCSSMNSTFYMLVRKTFDFYLEPRVYCVNTCNRCRHCVVSSNHTSADLPPPPSTDKSAK